MPGEGRPGPDATVTAGNLRGGTSEAEAQETTRKDGAKELITKNNVGKRGSFTRPPFAFNGCCSGRLDIQQPGNFGSVQIDKRSIGPVF